MYSEISETSNVARVRVNSHRHNNEQDKRSEQALNRKGQKIACELNSARRSGDMKHLTQNQAGKKTQDWLPRNGLAT